MSVYIDIQTAYIAAMKAKELIKKDILNYMFSQLKNKQIDLMRPITDEESIQMIKKEIKNRQESITFAQQAGKTEDVLIEQQKIDILMTYLPAQLSEEKLREIIQSQIAALQITDLQKQRGLLISAIMKEYGPSVDGGLLNRIISSL